MIPLCRQSFAAALARAWITAAAHVGHQSSAQSRLGHGPKSSKTGEVSPMRIFAPKLTAYAHCDLPCGVYDPAQARIEAESVKAIQEKYQANEDPAFRTRAIAIQE